MQTDQSSYRNYDGAAEKVRDTYRIMRSIQTYDFAGERIAEYENRVKEKINVWDAIKKLETFVDLSDPDMTLPNIYHLFQTAEGLRKDSKPEWMQVIGLIHDLGKILYTWGSDETGTTMTTQWAIVGDTFITGCELPSTLVYSEFNSLNPDMQDPKLSTKYGVYIPNIGLSNCRCSWGHDEYLYRVLKDNKVNLPDEALYIVRFHSLYAFHDKREYSHLWDEYDRKMHNLVKTFSSYDLYTKADISKESMGEYYDSLKPYYEELISKYIGEFLYF